MLRWASPCDDDALGWLMFEAIHAEPSPYSVAERRAWRSEPHSGPEWSERLSAQSVLIAEDAQGPVGFLTLRPDGYLDLGYLLPRGRGRGLFRQLHERIEAEARARGLTRLFTHASLGAEGPFLAMGYVVTEREVVDRHGQRLHRCAMERALPGSIRTRRLGLRVDLRVRTA